MKFTNRKDLPDAIVAAVMADEYDNGGSDITVTSLIKPPQMVALQKLHHDEIEEDVADHLYAMLGQIGHKIAERGAPPNVLAEVRFFTEVSGWKVSGQVDQLEINHGDKVNVF